MGKCVNLIVIGVMLTACHSTTERPIAGSEASPSTQQEAASLRGSFDECIDRAGAITPEMQECIEEEFLFQQARMDAALAKLGMTFAGSQHSWEVRKDAECRWDAKTEGQAQRLEANFCSLKRIAARADELEASLGR